MRLLMAFFAYGVLCCKEAFVEVAKADLLSWL